MEARSDIAHLNPPEPGRWGGPLTIALGIHGLLILALAWGVAWQKDTQVVLEAELWSRLPQVAAPPAVEPPPPPPAPPAPEPRPAPTPPPPPAPSEADIAVQRAEAQRRLEEQQRLAQQRAEQRRLEEQRRAEEARRRQLEAQRAQEARERAERDRREREQLAQLEAERKRNLERMMGQAGATGSSQSPDMDQPPKGPSAIYGERLGAAIRPNIVFTDLIPGNPRAEVELRVLPDGTIVSVRLRQSSGFASWDSAVLRAIERTGRLPPDENGRIPGTLLLGFRPQD
jgi:colicin import membrane protein